MQVKKDKNEVMWRDKVKLQDLSTLIGKEAADRLLEIEANSGGGRMLRGKELAFGGDGMVGFYDKILPDFARGYIKKYDSHLEQKTLSNKERVWSFEITPKMRESILKDGQAMFAVTATIGLLSEGNNE